MNTTTEYLTETQFRAAVKKALGKSVHSKKDTEDMRSGGVHVYNAEGHWAKDSIHFRVEPGRYANWDQTDIDRSLVLAGFEMVPWTPSNNLVSGGVHIAWRKSA